MKNFTTFKTFNYWIRNAVNASNEQSFIMAVLMAKREAFALFRDGLISEEAFDECIMNADTVHPCF